MGYLVLAFLISIVGPGLAVAVAVASAYLVARRLGIPEFRPFRPGAREARGKRFLVRAVSVLAAFAVCFAGGALSVRASGIHRSSMSVDVLPGPAHDAGLRDGDRIVSIDGKPYDDFEAMRADIQASQGPRSVTFERNGERITREVDPMPERRIGVSARREKRPATFAETIGGGFSMCFSPFRYFQTTKVALAGAIGVVKSMDRPAVSPFEMFLYAGSYFAAFVWPALLFLNLLDVLILSFRRNGV